MNIGIFSGSFNPIHIGHRILANYVLEFSDIDELWLLVTPQNPFKENSSLLPENIRLEMTKLAFKDFDKVKVSDIEFSLPRPSYTINTLEILKQRYPEHNFSLIVGADNWNSFDKWYESDKIIDQFRIYVYPRLSFDIDIPTHLKAKIKELNSPIIEISSTFIRDSIREGKNVQAFVPQSVYRYIKSHNLYASNTNRT